MNCPLIVLLGQIVALDPDGDSEASCNNILAREICRSHLISGCSLLYIPDFGISQPGKALLDLPAKHQEKDFIFFTEQHSEHEH